MIMLLFINYNNTLLILIFCIYLLNYTPIVRYFKIHFITTIIIQYNKWTNKLVEHMLRY